MAHVSFDLNLSALMAGLFGVTLTRFAVMGHYALHRKVYPGFTSFILAEFFALLAMLAVVLRASWGELLPLVFLTGWAPCCSLWRPTTGWACLAAPPGWPRAAGRTSPGRACGPGLPGRPPPRTEHGPPGLIFLAIAFIVSARTGWNCSLSAAVHSPGSGFCAPATLSLRPSTRPACGFAGRHRVRLRLHDAFRPAAGGLCLCAHSAIRAGTVCGVFHELANAGGRPAAGHCADRAHGQHRCLDRRAEPSRACRLWRGRAAQVTAAQAAFLGHHARPGLVQAGQRHPGPRGGDALLKAWRCCAPAPCGRTTCSPASAGRNSWWWPRYTGSAEALQLAERIRLAVESEHFEATGGARVTASFGLASSRTASLEELLGQADTALYAAKQGGRNRVELAIDLAAEPA